MKRVLVLGGRSEIGRAVVHELRLHHELAVTLAVRAPTEVEKLHDLGGVPVNVVAFDAGDLASHERLVDGWFADDGFDVVILAFGILGDQVRAERDAMHVVDILHVDFVAQAHLLTLLSNAMRARDAGIIVVFSSIAGARTRRANYVYGSAKAGLDGFATGLASALRGSGVHLVLARPGFVIGRMTEGMKPAPWSSTPDDVARAAVRAMHDGRSSVWVPGILRWVAAAMRFMPEPLWRRMPR